MKSHSKMYKKSMCLTILIILIICSFESKISQSKKSEGENKTSKANKDSSTKLSSKMLESLNSLGVKVSAKTVLEGFPYKVTRCDQIAIVKGEYITDLKDYSKRKQGLFVLTAHHANLFPKRDPEKLLQSILLSETKSFPTEIRGARGCLTIDAGVKNKMVICVDSTENAQNIIEVLKKFADCRGGLLVGEATKKVQIIAKQTCQDNLRKTESAKKEDDKQKSEFFHPGDNRVPGSLPHNK